MTGRALLLAIGFVCVPAAVLAQPVPGTEDLSKKSATELRDLGNKLFDDKLYLGALAAYKEAYRRLPSVKILLNIGVTLNKLERFADAANVFQHYVQENQADPAMKPEIEKVMVDLDKRVGLLELTITPADALIKVNDGDWGLARKFYRVVAGTVTIDVKKEGFLPQTKPARTSGPIAIAAGEKQVISITIERVPAKIIRVEVPTPKVQGPRARFGAMAMKHLDIPHKGAATRIAVTFDVIDRLAVQGGALIGPNSGGYIGGAFAILTGNFRPIITVGMPVLFSDGARLRGAGGIELQLNRHLALTAELGVEYMVNPEDIKETVFVPAVGATGRL